MNEAAAPRKKPFSMIREFHLADWFTLANAVCGVGSMFAIITFIQTGEVHHVYYACALVLAALVFDIFDGRVARWRQKSSLLGRELDSLADVISFGVAPALIAFLARPGGIAAPVVDTSRCTGCGACVAPCPTRAIRVA